MKPAYTKHETQPRRYSGDTERMKYNPKIHRRRSIRLQGYDYSQAGAYFVTICTQNRKCVFGDVVDGQMRLNDSGSVLQKTWDSLPDHYPHVQLDACVIMPNHIHGIIVLNSVGAGFKPAPVRHGLSEIVRSLKSFSSRHINERRQTPGVKLWQRNYWERIVRHEPEWLLIREYIHNNPAKWEFDALHPDKPGFHAVDVGAGFKPAPTSGTGPAGSREPLAMYGYIALCPNDDDA